MVLSFDSTIEVDKSKIEIDRNALTILIEFKQLLRANDISNATYSEAIREMKRKIVEKGEE